MRYLCLIYNPADIDGTLTPKESPSRRISASMKS